LLFGLLLPCFCVCLSSLTHIPHFVRSGLNVLLPFSERTIKNSEQMK